MESVNKKTLELLVFRHAESTFIASFFERKDEFERNKTDMLPFEHEKLYIDFAL